MPLDYSKCMRCRSDRQKCLPVGRLAPAKCFRCEKKNLPCSDPIVGKPGRPKSVKKPRRIQQNKEVAESSRIDDPGDALGLLQLETYSANVSLSRASTALSLQPSQTESARTSDLLFLLSWYPMLKQAMTKLEFLNNEIMSNFDILQWECSKAFKEFETFTEELVPIVLRELQHENPLALPPSVVQLLGDCVHKPIKKTPDQCSDTLDEKRSIDVHVQDIDLVHEFQSGITRLLVHQVFSCDHPTHICPWSDALYVQSELRSVEAISERITTKISGIFHKNDITQRVLPRSIRESAVFIPDYQGIFHHSVLSHGPLDCLGRNLLHRYFDKLAFGDHSWISGDVKTSLEKHAHLWTEADILGRSPLHIAMSKNMFFTELFGDLLCTPAVNMKTVYGHTPLHYLAFKTEELAQFFEKRPKNLSRSEVHHYLDEYVLDVGHKSALSRVMQHSSTSRAKYFLENFCIHINSRDEHTDNGPLMEAIEYDRTDIVHHLLRLPAVDANVREFDLGNTPLLCAIKNESLLILELLGNWNGLKWDKTNVLGQMALHLAAFISEDDRFLTYLLGRQEPIDVNVRDRDDWTPLHCAADRAAVENISLLLKVNGIEVNAQDNEGNTPLMYLVRECGKASLSNQEVDEERIMAIKILMRDMRVDANVPNNIGQTAITVARKPRPLDRSKILPYLLRQPSLYED